jgi:DNA-damage-inducible protein J
MEVHMAKSAMIRARVDPKLKEDAENVFEELGLSVTQAITLYYQQVKLTRGIPFEIRLPNETTVQTFAETDADENIIRFENAQEMFDELGI